jgi:hypothetical protein
MSIARSKPAQFRKFYGASRATVAKAKPELCASGWEITIPGAFATIWGEAASGEACDHTWAWCVRAINAMRAEMMMPDKAFPPPPEKSRGGFIATSPKTLLHGTSRAAAQTIATRGLIPQVGAFTARTYGTDSDDLVFAGSARDIHRVVAAMYVATGDEVQTDSDFFRLCALVTVDNDGLWYRQKAGYESPRIVESGDYYRFVPIAAKAIVMGDDLRAFFENRIGQMPSDFIDFIDPDMPTAQPHAVAA